MQSSFFDSNPETWFYAAAYTLLRQLVFWNYPLEFSRQRGVGVRLGNCDKKNSEDYMSCNSPLRLVTLAIVPAERSLINFHFLLSKRVGIGLRPLGWF